MIKLPTKGALGFGLAAILGLWGAPAASAQSDSTPPASRGENFSNKPAPALFQADCTGGGCHKGPQGLAKGYSQSGLAGFLREHYTNSRESAAALSAYLLKLPVGPAQPPPRAASTREAQPSAQARSGPSWFDPEPPGPSEARPSRQQPQRPARAAARAGEDAAPPPAAVPSAPAAAESARPTRGQRGRQQPTAATAAPPAPEPPPPQFDIFD